MSAPHPCLSGHHRSAGSAAAPPVSRGAAASSPARSGSPVPAFTACVFGTPSPTAAGSNDMAGDRRRWADGGRAPAHVRHAGR